MYLEYARYKEEEEVLVLITAINSKVSYYYSYNNLITLIRNLDKYKQTLI